MIHDAIVVRGGPAGLSAALFLARAGLKVLVIDGEQSALREVPQVPNYPGLPEAPSGEALLERLRAHARSQGAEVAAGRVEAVRDEGGVFALTLHDGTVHKAEALLLATHDDPTVANLLGLQRNGLHVHTDFGGRTSYPRVYACGAVRGLVPDHAITSAGDGAWVAVNLVSDLRGEPYRDYPE